MKKQIWNLLRRKTSSVNFIPEIDGFRFFAIFSVLLYHLNTHLSRVIAKSFPDFNTDTPLRHVMSEGGIGVSVFFAISGFILALPFAKQRLFQEKPIELKGYYLRRITRLEPPYVISLIGFFLLQVVLLHESFRELLPHFIASLFYVHNIVFNQWSSINPVAWSLEVEVQFYILAPPLAAVFGLKNKYIRRTLLITVMLACMVHYNFNYDWIKSVHLRKSLLMHLHQFLVGFIFVDFFLTDWREFLKVRSYLYDVVGVLCLALLFVFNDPFNLLHDVVFSASLFIALMSVFKGTLLNKFFTNPYVVIIGGMCYTIYLLHYALLAFLIDRTGFLIRPDLSYNLNFFLQALLVLPVVLLVSAIFFILIERPCMDKDWPRKLKAKVISFWRVASL